GGRILGSEKHAPHRKDGGQNLEPTVRPVRARRRTRRLRLSPPYFLERAPPVDARPGDGAGPLPASIQHSLLDRIALPPRRRSGGDPPQGHSAGPFPVP